MRQDYPCNKRLTSRAKALRLQKFIRPRLDLERSLPDHAVASTVEAILGAVWLDSGESLQKVNKVMRKINLYPARIYDCA